MRGRRAAAVLEASPGPLGAETRADLDGAGALAGHLVLGLPAGALPMGALRLAAREGARGGVALRPGREPSAAAGNPAPVARHRAMAKAWAGARPAAGGLP